MKGTNTRQIGASITRGHLPAIQIVSKDGRHENGAWAFWAVKRSDAEAWQFKPPAYDLMDRKHAFMLLASAIGLSGMTIGNLVKLSHCTVSQRVQLMNNPRHLKKVIAKYGFKDIEYLPKVGVHADWRKYAYRFSRVRSAFARYRDGKATTEDCYLILRILKCQMAAAGVKKVNINVLGKITLRAVDNLVERMRESGIKPYLLSKSRKQ